MSNESSFGFGAGVNKPATKQSTSPSTKKSSGPASHPKPVRKSDKKPGPGFQGHKQRPKKNGAKQPAPKSADPVEAYLEKIQTPATNTVTSFDEFQLGKRIGRGIEAAGYTSPRPIQSASIQAILEGRDILGLAQTGTGKTAAFVLPILHRLLEPGKRGAFPRILVLSPTRELTNQIHQEFGQLGKFTGVKSMTVFGGVSQAPQLRALRTQPEVVVACPGRLLDLLKQGVIRLGGVEVLVLDEADHMFDMGFLPDVRKIISYLPKSRQNLLFSATMPGEIRGLTKEVLNDPLVVELNHTAPIETIEHKLFPVHPTRKGDLLQHIICEDGFRTAIVFTRTKYRAKNLAVKLGRSGHRAVALQGNMSQPQRDKAMAGFKDGTFDIMVATDIAARGIDVAGVSHVINFDVPNTPEAYMHRIGRTGRSEREGKACTFVTNEDFSEIKAIEKKLDTPIQRVKLEDFSIGVKGGGDDLVRPKGGGRRPGGFGGFGGNKGGRGVAGQANKRRGGHRRGR